MKKDIIGLTVGAAVGYAIVKVIRNGTKVEENGEELKSKIKSTLERVKNKKED